MGHAHEHVQLTVGFADLELGVDKGLEMAPWEPLFQWQLWGE